MTKEIKFEVRDKRAKERFYLDDLYLNGYAKLCGIYATGVYLSLCRHSNLEQKCWPSIRKIAEELAVSEKQVGRAIKILESYKIISKERIGKKATNRYWLLNKSEWTDSPISEQTTSPITTDSQSYHQGTVSPFHSKVTHKKETHSKVLPKGKGKTPSPEINHLIKFLEDKLQGSLDGSQKENRRYCYLLLNRVKKDYPDKDTIKGIETLILAGLRDSFHGKNCTNFKYLFYNAQKIVQSFRGRTNKVVL